VSAVAENACAHCGLPSLEEFCCDGCRAVHELLLAGNLGRYYELRGARGVPVNDVRPERHDDKWLDEIEARRAETGVSRVDLDLQGIHCSACVWLVETLCERRGGLRVAINPSIGRAHLVVPRAFDLRAFVEDVERFGYRFGPPRTRPVRRSSNLLWRLGVCVAIAMNTMIFAIAIYAGLDSGPLHRLFEALNLALGAIAVLVGGSVFFQSAWNGLRRRVLHLDVPIALGIGLAFVGSVVAFFARRSSGIFVDTLDVFIALMLVGRFLQERVLERNRLALLENDGAEGLLARRERPDGRVETVKCVSLSPGDRIVVAAGDLVPVDAVLEDDASLSLDWLNGESAPRAFRRGDVVPAGAFSATSSPTTLVVERDFTRSGLVDLLRTPLSRSADATMGTPWWNRLSRIYAAGVLVVAAVGFCAWMIATRDFARSIEVTTAVLVVTCPCAFGIATPLAYDLALAGLRRAGLFVRTPTFLDRASRVRTVVFDKTGTLTSGALRVRDPEMLRALPHEARSALHDLAAATWHPKSAAVLRALENEKRGPGLVAEHPGRGVSLHRDGHEWRLGAPAWVISSKVEGDLVFGVDGRLVCTITTEEELRKDAKHEVSELRGDGYDVWLLSGDEQSRTNDAAQAAGIPQTHAIGSRSAQEKAVWVAEHDREDLLMVGDGINDALVVEQATCSGTPAIDRPFMAARSDFYFVTPGLRPVRLALAASKRVVGVRSRNLKIALAYNVLSIGLAYAGLMSPLLCAVLMPASSLVTVLTTVASLSPRSSLWKS
jgi:Cu2+-exporting ATPase